MSEAQSVRELLNSSFAASAKQYEKAAAEAVAKWLAFCDGHADPEILVWVDDYGKPVEVSPIKTPMGKGTPRPRGDDTASAAIWVFYLPHAHSVLSHEA